MNDRSQQSARGAASCRSATGPVLRTLLRTSGPFLSDVLSAGDQPASLINKWADEHGIAAGTLRRARERLDVVPLRKGNGKAHRAFWSLGPESAPFRPRLALARRGLTYRAHNMLRRSENLRRSGDFSGLLHFLDAQE